MYFNNNNNNKNTILYSICSFCKASAKNTVTCCVDQRKQMYFWGLCGLMWRKYKEWVVPMRPLPGLGSHQQFVFLHIWRPLGNHLFSFYSFHRSVFSIILHFVRSKPFSLVNYSDRQSYACTALEINFVNVYKRVKPWI